MQSSSCLSNIIRATNGGIGSADAENPLDRLRWIIGVLVPLSDWILLEGARCLERWLVCFRLERAEQYGSSAVLQSSARWGDQHMQFGRLLSEWSIVGVGGLLTAPLSRRRTTEVSRGSGR